MGESILDRGSWLPTVESRDGALQLTVIGGSGALHDPRSFSVPIRVEHMETMRDSLSRHLQLYSVLLPLCYAAGTREPWEEAAAAARLDPILFGSGTGWMPSSRGLVGIAASSWLTERTPGF